MHAADPSSPLGAWEASVREHAARLTSGTRVRIMPGEGCRHHGEQEAGITGVIADIDTRTWKYRPVATHPFLVLFDRPLPITRSTIDFWYYAAAELTPVPWPTPEEVVADTLRRLVPLANGQGAGEG